MSNLGLEEEVAASELQGRSVIIALDANAKLGPDYIKADPHNDLVEHIQEIHIDEERHNVLTKNVKTKTGIVHTQSDHNLIHTKLKLSWSPTFSDVVEVFDFRDIEGKLMFKRVTTENKQLSEIVD